MADTAHSCTATQGAVAVWHALRLGRGTGGVARGREFVWRLLTGGGVPGEVDPLRLGDVLVIVSELVTNTLDHTGEVPVLVLGVRGRLVHVEVRDADPALPREQVPLPAEPHGRGIVLVARLSDAHGVRRLPGRGKAVWAELRV